MTDLHPSKFFPAWLVKTLGGVLGIVALVACSLCAVLTFLLVKQEGREAERDKQIAVITANFQVIHEQAKLRDIIAEKLPNLDIDTQAKLAFEYSEAGKRLGCPTWMLLGLTDLESNWNPKAVSKAGAVGLLQVMPSTALDVAPGVGVVITSLDQLKDPLTCFRLGVQHLLNVYRSSVMQGKSPEGDFTRSLYLYNGRGEAYARLVMEKAAYYQKLLSQPPTTQQVAALAPPPLKPIQ